MIRSFRYAYVLAKLYGMLARTYVGRNFEDLLRLRKLEDLSRRLFPEKAPGGPQLGHPLEADEIEERIVGQTIRSLLGVLSLLGEPDEILIHLLRSYEYQGVKSVMRAIVNGTGEEPRIRDLEKYAGIRFVPGGDHEKSLASSPYSWILPLLKEKPLFELENMLDRDYYATLRRLVRKLPPADRRGVERLVTLEISLANVTWALRLRFFFSVDEESARPLLIPGGAASQRRALAEAFQIQADSLDGWRAWRYSWLLEDQLGESFRSPDPVRAEQKAARRLYVRAHQLFHEDPFTLTPIASFFRLKQFETSLLMTAVEGVRLAIPEQEILSFAGGL
ncbi:MAG TPA: V-type ATPase subunit [Spirochaetia bacterium]|nr:V-type ATPase subunit [Spirochaetia bacterium]